MPGKSSRVIENLSWRAGVFLWLWGPVVGWAYGIFYLSHIPGLTVAFGLWDFILRKFGHFTEYFILSALIFRAVRRIMRRAVRRRGAGGDGAGSGGRAHC